MVLSMGHSGVKFIIEKISKSLESEYKVLEVREKIIDRTMNGEKPAVRIDQGLLEDARKMGREGILTSMVLYDMNKSEAKEMATRNLLEYRSTNEPIKQADIGSSSSLSNQQTCETTIDGASEDAISGDVSVRKVQRGGQTVTEVITECTRDKLLEVIQAPEGKATKID